MQISIGSVIRPPVPSVGLMRLDQGRFPTLASLSALAIGAIVLVGWLLDIDVMKSIVPGAMTMRVMAAITILLMSLGLLIMARPSVTMARPLAAAPILAGLVLGLLGASQYATGWDLGIDQALFREPLGQVGTVIPNRTSPIAVICFLLLGFGLLLSAIQRGHRVALVLHAGAALIAGLTIIDFAFGSSVPTLMAGSTQMALATAVAVVLLSVGGIVAIPERGLLDVLSGDSSSAHFARRLLVASLVVPVGLTWLHVKGEELGVWGSHYGASLLALTTFVPLAYLVLRGSRANQRLEGARQAAIDERDRFFDVSMDMLATANADGYFIRLNPAWTQVLGYGLDELMARPFIAFVHPDDVDATNVEAARQIEAGQSVLNFQNRYRHRDGSYRWLEWTSTPSADGSRLHAVARDVTERRLEDERLRAPEIARARRLAGAIARIEAIIETGAFAPVFQPVVDLATRTAVGYEALTRFADGERPDEMFALASECGLGVKLEAATLRVALDAAQQLPRRAWLSLNVSPKMLADVDRLGAILGLRTRPIVLEVTEHETIEGYGPLRDAVARLGPDVRLAVDDAGAGIANFNHLVELHPAFVKIDIGLVRGVDADPSRRAVVAALIHFAAESGCQAIAEGIETEAELATLEDLGVTLGQGYLLARPAPVDEWSVTKRSATRRLGPDARPFVEALQVS